MQNETQYRSIVLIGKAGTGKGTQAKMLSDHFGYKLFSTGDKTRQTAAMDTPLGRTIEQIHTRGWIPEWLASYFLVKVLLEEHVDDGLVFESVARKPEEARKLHEIHTTLERTYIVIWLDAEDDVLTERLLKRNRPGYDTRELIEERRKAFLEETMQSIDFFAGQGTLQKVGANSTAEEVFTNILKVLD